MVPQSAVLTRYQPPKILKSIRYFRQGPVLVMWLTANRKLGCCSATYVSQQTCPRDCPFLVRGCYAKYNRADGVGRVTFSLNSQRGYSNFQIAKLEAAAIDSLRSPYKLRVHVVGDVTSKAAASLIGKAMVQYEQHNLQLAWTYTHAWPTVPIESWAGARVLASCETPTEVRQAQARGYPTSIVVQKFQQRTVYKYRGISIVPCPNQTTKGKVKCDRCNICMNVEMLRQKKLTVGFEVHGGAVGKREALAALKSKDKH